MTKVYIDFDGVILDTWEIISKEYYNKFESTDISEDNIKKLMIDIGWNNILKNSKEINYSIEKIKQISKIYDICILSKINSINEEKEKSKFLLNNEIKEMCFVPYASSKTQYVDPQDNILIDDDIKNLEEWEQHGGKAIFFNKDLNNHDSYGNINDKFVIINDLLRIYDII